MEVAVKVLDETPSSTQASQQEFQEFRSTNPALAGLDNRGPEYANPSRLRVIYECPQPTPMILNLNVHYSRASDIVIPDFMTTNPSVPITAYRDGFGNWCTRIVAPQGRIRIASTGVVRDSGEPDEVAPSAGQHLVQDLPEESLVFLLGSRYCETDHLSQTAWDLFGSISTRLAAGSGDLRFRPQAHHFRLRARASPETA